MGGGGEEAICQQAPRPLLLSNHRLLDLPQMPGLLGCGLSLVEAKEKVTLEHFLAEPHPSPPTAAVWTSFLLGLRAGGVGGECRRSTFAAGMSSFF